MESTFEMPEGLSVCHIDFAYTSLSCYSGAYALVIDDLFSPEECADLITLAESTESDSKGVKGWQPAMIQVGPKPTDQAVDTEFRFNDRILRFDHEAARKIYEKLLPYVQGDIGVVEEGSKWGAIVGGGPQVKVRGTWKLVGLNERLSFLRYGPGHFFQQHYDSQLNLDDGRKSRVTIQIYLNGTKADGLVGGATRFWDPAFRKYLDVEPKVGRVLIFQQGGLWHSGERVEKGLKYTLRSDLMFERS